jgi:hypothetical protein
MAERYARRLEYGAGRHCAVADRVTTMSGWTL